MPTPRPPFARRTLRSTAAATVLSLLAACTGSDADTPAPNLTADATNGADSQAKDAAPTPVPLTNPDSIAFLGAYKPILEKAKTISLPEFLAEHTPADAPKEAKPGYKPLQAKYFDLIDQKLELTPAEKARIDSVGFMVSDRLQKPTMAEALLDVYAKDLPVLVTTDLILQALHASYDDILKTLEEHMLIATIGDVLKKTQAALTKVDPGTALDAKLAHADADFFLTVARSLLAGSPQKANGGAAIDAQVTAFLAHVAGLEMKDVTIFGVQRKMDFSQFKPRGHYEGNPALERYFRAMMWLGRADLRFAEFDVGVNAWVVRSRQLMAALLLHQAVNAGAGLPGWQSADDLIGLMVGPVDYIDFKGVAKLVADQGLVSASTVAGLDAQATDSLLAALLSGKYGSQRIASHWLATDPHSATPTPLAPSFAFLGQRFVVDSHVFSNVVYDRIVHDGKKVQRVLPNPLDALFVMGNDLVLPLLAPDFAAHSYWGSLHGLRWLVDSYDASFWQSNVYNLWLDSLRQLNAPTTAAKYPFAMRTPAWRDKVANTQLASWAQLRHDTLLYAKQSYTGGVACEHPAGYVEPYPAFYQRLETLADVAGQALANAQVEQPWVQTQIATFFTNWKQVMGTLRSIAERELKGESLTAADQAFLKKIIETSPGCGSPMFSGWYTSLYFSADNFDKWKPTIADVHTNPNTGPLPGPNVLHVATGNVSLMVFTVDTCTGAEAFVGPVFRYHEVDVKKIERLSDKDWEKMLKDGTAPEPPVWTQSFRVLAPK